VSDHEVVSLDHLPRFVDISCVQAFHSKNDIDRLIEDAVAGDFVSAHVLPHWVPYVRERLQGTNTLVGAPVSFPAGGNRTETKVFEAERLLEDGVQEMDVVVNISRLLSGERDYVTDELSRIVALVDNTVPLRAILEVGHLDEQAIRLGAECAVDAGVAWVKTATGWSGKPTTVEHIRIIADQVRGRAKLKAAGGIRDLETVAAMVELGVTRFGMNSAVAVALATEAAEAGQ
jgi:deoxyribose-phosphate aldolase